MRVHVPPVRRRDEAQIDARRTRCIRLTSVVEPESDRKETPA